MILFKKEKEVIELIIKHLDLAVDSLKTGIQTIDCYLKDDIGDAKRLAREVRSLESDADIVRYNLRDKLYSGAYLPLLREDIYKLIESIDTPNSFNLLDDRLADTSVTKENAIRYVRHGSMFQPLPQSLVGSKGSQV